MDIDAERELRIGIVAREQLAHVSRPGEPQKTGLVLERLGHLVGAEALVLLEPQQEPRVDRARAGRHDEALERCEPHRGVHRAAVENGAQRCARAEMTGHHSARVTSRASGIGMRQAMEAVAPQDISLSPRSRKRVGGGLRRERGVKRGVEARDLRDVRQRSSDRVERSQRLRLVERRERSQLAELGLDLLVDDDRFAKALASVNDPVSGDVGGGG